MTNDMFDLSGCVAAVIGGTGVLGGAICHGLADAGAAVAVLGRSAERGAARVAALEASGASAISVSADATDPAALGAALLEIQTRLGPVDIVVNAPGVNSATPFFDIELEEWHALLDSNLTAVFVACQVFGRAMVAGGRGGSIINISSASSGPPLSKVLTYSVAKAGLNNLTQYLAAELAPHNVRVNAIASRTAASCPMTGSRRSSDTRQPVAWASRTSWLGRSSGSPPSGPPALSPVRSSASTAASAP
jgi:NAD(P)-dependent dehydrogenase (short-subunit alcohol dehydrogenase family)